MPPLVAFLGSHFQLSSASTLRTVPFDPSLLLVVHPDQTACRVVGRHLGPGLGLSQAGVKRCFPPRCYCSIPIGCLHSESLHTIVATLIGVKVRHEPLSLQA